MSACDDCPKNAELTRCLTNFFREPIGENFVQVCTTTPCMLRGAYDILNTVCSELGGIKPGETTKDGKFTVIEVECQGACSNAPMLVVGDDFYVSLSCFLHLVRCVWVLIIAVYVICRRILQMRQPRRCWMRSRRVKSPSRALRVVVIRVRTRLALLLLLRRFVPNHYRSGPNHYAHLYVTPFIAVRPRRVLHRGIPIGICFL